MISTQYINAGDAFWLKRDIGSLKMGTIVYARGYADPQSNNTIEVSVNKRLDNDTILHTVLLNDLGDFAVSVHGSTVFYVLGYNDEESLKKYNYVKCIPSISKSVRGGDNDSLLEEGTDILYYRSISDKWPVRTYQNDKVLSDQEIIDILFEEILYDAQPDLQLQSLVGYLSNTGIDKNPNYHDGYYLLENGKTYTMTWCKGIVKIREGMDGGWYQGTSSVGRTLFEGEIDWKRYRDALVKKEAKRLLSNSSKFCFDNVPGLQELMYDYMMKKDDEFLLSSEIKND